jgi:5-methylcytosine-specific restriction endonuclease McrA
MQPFKHDPPFSRQMHKGNRLKGQAWTNLRRRWLMHHPHCARCGVPGEEVHHIVPRAVAPMRTLDPSNLETLCKACHLATHHHA